jgi:hypothetical protein
MKCSFFLPFFISVVRPLSYLLFYSFISSLTVLFSITIFLVRLYGVKSNEQLALSRLMHIVRCGSAIFPHQALDRISAQGTIMGCAGLIEKKIENFEHAPLIYIVYAI